MVHRTPGRHRWRWGHPETALDCRLRALVEWVAPGAGWAFDGSAGAVEGVGVAAGAGAGRRWDRFVGGGRRRDRFGGGDRRGGQKRQMRVEPTGSRGAPYGW